MNTYSNPISFYIAEVVAVANKETYTLKDQQFGQLTGTDSFYHIYDISCKIVTPNPFSPIIDNIKPADINTKKIPLIGEQVLIFQGYHETSKPDELKPGWYYLTTLSITSNVNYNGITGLTQTNLTGSNAGTSFIEQSDISLLQAYEGDVITEGRWGNSIRFSSTIDIKKARVEIQPNYTGTSGDPIILLSNRNRTTDTFVTENIVTDASSLYLTSKQRITNLKTNRTISSNISSVSNFNNSQLIGVADRIILKSKTDSIIFDAKEKMELNAETIYIGSSTNKEPMLHSTAVVSLLQKIVSMLKIGFADSSGVICTPIYDSLIDAEKLMTQLTNDNIQIDAYKSNNFNT